MKLKENLTRRVLWRIPHLVKETPDEETETLIFRENIEKPWVLYQTIGLDSILSFLKVGSKFI